jgi:cell division protein FtsN
MAAPRRRGLRPGGVVRAIGRLTLLVGLGFGAGLVIGVVSEEPKLLAGHLRGEGQSVELVAHGSESNAEDSQVASAASSTGSSSAETKASTKPDRDDPALPPVAAAPPPAPAARPSDAKRSAQSAGADAWAIQVGAFGDEAAATKLSKGLVAKGYPAELVAPAGQRQWRVRIQPIHGRAKASEMADRLKRVERLPTWVIPMEDRSAP